MRTKFDNTFQLFSLLFVLLLCACRAASLYLTETIVHIVLFIGNHSSRELLITNYTPCRNRLFQELVKRLILSFWQFCRTPSNTNECSSAKGVSFKTLTRCAISKIIFFVWGQVYKITLVYSYYALEKKNSRKKLVFSSAVQGEGANIARSNMWLPGVFLASVDANILGIAT